MGSENIKKAGHKGKVRVKSRKKMMGVIDLTASF